MYKRHWVKATDVEHVLETVIVNDGKRSEAYVVQRQNVVCLKLTAMMKSALVTVLCCMEKLSSGRRRRRRLGGGFVPLSNV